MRDSKSPEKDANNMLLRSSWKHVSFITTMRKIQFRESRGLTNKGFQLEKSIQSVDS